MGIEPIISPSQGGVLPLHYKHHVIHRGNAPRSLGFQANALLLCE